MKEALKIVLKELTKAREAYEAADQICDNPYASADAWRERHEAWGRWNGVAKVMEALTSAH